MKLQPPNPFSPLGCQREMFEVLLSTRFVWLLLVTVKNCVVIHLIKVKGEKIWMSRIFFGQTDFGSYKPIGQARILNVYHPWSYMSGELSLSLLSSLLFLSHLCSLSLLSPPPLSSAVISAFTLLFSLFSALPLLSLFSSLLCSLSLSLSLLFQGIFWPVCIS